MLKSYDKVLDNAAWIKQETIYKETTVTTKAKIFYFHGGGLLYGFRKTYQKNIFPLLLRQVMKLFPLIIPLLQQQILNKLFQIYVIQHGGLFPQ